MMRKKSRWGLLIALAVTAVGITFVAVDATSSPYSSLPIEKQQIENNYAQLAQNSHVAKKSSDTSLKPVHHDQLPSGILNIFSPPFHADDVTIRNVWQQQINGDLVQVYAGNVSNDSTQGIVIVQTTAADGSTKEQRFLTNEKAGALKLVAANNLKLSLASDQGTAYEFDVQGKALGKK